MSTKTMPASNLNLCVISLLGLTLAAAGCGSGLRTYPAEGKVVLKDGAPLTEGNVSFEAVDGSLSATGRIDRQGFFELSTLKPGDGIPAGDYRVVIVPAVSPDLDVPPPATLFHSRYRRYETSGLKFTVKEAYNYFEITLDPPDSRTP